MPYTEKQLEKMYKSYEQVRLSGKWNMFDIQARMKSGLTKEEYLYVMKHYSELREKFEK